jgi:GWxTD domain-containing protein
LKGLFRYRFIFLLTCIVACTSNRQYTSRPTKSLINPDSDLLEVNALAYHLNDSVTQAFIEIVNENVLYKRPDTTQAFYAELRVSYKLLSGQNSRNILDSGSFYLQDRAAGELVAIKSLNSKFILKARRKNNYFLDIDVFDVNRRTKYSKGLNIYKQDNYSAQNFLVSHNDTIAFKNHFLKGDEVTISFNNSAVTQVLVDCYFREFAPALPPFSVKPPDEQKYLPDSIFNLELSSGRFVLKMPDKGFYHIKANPQSMEGLSLFTFDKTFPGVGNTEEMINCTRYLMSREEFEDCKNSSDRKSCIDKFWLNIGGSNERARELLRRYYGRVKEANKYYTSYTQGWKSDRGMIFIVFGPPTNTYRSRNDEIWVYGNESNPSSLRFIFNKTQNPFSDNDFILERSQFYKEPWHTAVDYWRQGHVYIDNSRR